MSKLDLLLEAERRGILPEDKKGLLEEARRRGLVPGGEADVAPAAPTAPAVAEAAQPTASTRTVTPEQAPSLEVGLFPPRMILGSENVAAYRKKQGDTSGTPEYKAEIEAEAARRQQSKVPGEAITPTQATIGETASFGAYPQIMAAGRAGIDKAKSLVTGEDVDFEKTYGRERDIMRAQINKDRETRGFWGNLPGDIAGGLAMAPGKALVTAGEAAAQAAPAAATAARSFGERAWQYASELKEAAKAGAGYGGVYGVNVETGDWGDKLTSGAAHAAGGAVVAPGLKVGLDAVPAALGAAKNAWKSAMGPQANRAIDVARAAGVEDTLPTHTMGGPVMQGTASYIAGGIGGGKTRADASTHIDNLAAKIQANLEKDGIAGTTDEAGEMAQAFLREQLFEKQLPKQGRDVKNMSPQERHDLSGIPPAANVKPTVPGAKAAEPERLTPGQQYLDSLQRYHEHTDRILKTEAPLKEGMANHNIVDVSYSPEKQSYVVSRGDGSTYLADWKGIPLSKGVAPEESIYLRNLVSWLNEQPKQNQTLEGLKTAADEYAAKLVEAAKQIQPKQAAPVEPVAPQYKDPASITANAAPDGEVAQLTRERDNLARVLAENEQKRGQAILDSQKEPFFREIGPDSPWLPMLEHYNRPRQDPSSGYSPASVPEMHPDFPEFVKHLASATGDNLQTSARRAYGIIDTYTRLRSTRQLQDDGAARLREIEGILPERQSAALANQKLAQEQAVAQARKDAEQAAEAQTAAAQRQAREAAEAETARLREAEVARVRPAVSEEATRRVSELDQAVLQRAQQESVARAAAERARQADEIARRSTEGMGAPKERVNYPDMHDARYRQVENNAPAGVRANLLGDAQSKTNPGSETSTSKLLHDIMSEAQQRMQVPGYEGTIFGVKGDLLPAVQNYLRQHLGDDIAERLASYGAFRAKMQAPPADIKGLVRIRSDLRAAAREAASPPYPGQPLRNDAAMLSRLEQAVDRDLRRFAADSGPTGKAWLKQLDFADTGYREYVEMRSLLSKIFGHNNRTRESVSPGKAMEILREATQVNSNNFNTLKAFYKAIDEKGTDADRFRVTASLLRNLLGETEEAGKQLHPTAILENFISKYKNISKDARDLMAQGKSTEFIRALDKLYDAALPMESFVRSAGPGYLVRPGATSHLVTHNLPTAAAAGSLGFVLGLPGVLAGALAGVGGVKGLDRLLNAKWLAGWMRAMPTHKPLNSPEWVKHTSRLRAMATESLGLNDETGKALGEALKNLMGSSASAAEASPEGASGGDGSPAKPDEGQADAFVNDQGQLEINVGRKSAAPEDSSGTARAGQRLPGEAAPKPQGTAIVGGLKGKPIARYPDGRAVEVDPEDESEAYANREIPAPKGPERAQGLLLRENPGAAPEVYAWEDAKEMMTPEGQYRIGEQDDEGVQKAAGISGAAMAGSMPSGLAATPAGSFAGTFISKPGASNLAKRGYPTAERAIAMAEALEKRGASVEEIEARVAPLLREDPKLATVHKGNDGQWTVEIDDSGRTWKAPQPEDMKPGEDIKTTMGKAMPHPYLEMAEPGYKSLPLTYRGPDPKSENFGSYRPGRGKRKPEVEVVADPNQDVRKSAAHEAFGHYVAEKQQRPRGTNLGGEMARIDPAEVAAHPEISKIVMEMSEVAARNPSIRKTKEWAEAREILHEIEYQVRRDIAKRNYLRNEGEVDADLVARRLDMSVDERIATPARKMERYPREEQTTHRGDDEFYDLMEGRAPALSKETTHEIAKRFKAGEPMRELAREHDVSLSVVQRAFERHNVTLTPEEAAKLEYGWRAGAEGSTPKLGKEQVGEIKDKLAVPGTKTRKVAMEHDISARRMSDAITRAGLGNLYWLKKGLAKETAEKVGHMRTKGVSYADIAKDMGLTKNQVEHIIAFHELATGKRARAERFSNEPLAVRMRKMEDDLKAQKLSPDKIAEKINEAEGLNVTGDDITNGNVWWRVREESDFDPHLHTTSGDTWGNEGDGNFWESEKGSRRLPGHEVDEDFSESRTVYPKSTPKPSDHHSFTQPRNKRGQFSGPPKENALTH